MTELSQKPYLIRALYEWCVDANLTPYLAVVVDRRTLVPRSFVRDGQIVLNISPDAVHQMVMGNEVISFQARFGGVAQSISVPIGNVQAIYARETGEGMGFDVDIEEDGVPDSEQDAPVVVEMPTRKPTAESAAEPRPEADSSAKPAVERRSHLKVVK